MENGTDEQIVTQLETELKLIGLEGPDELQTETVTHNTANTNADRPTPACNHCKIAGDYRNQCPLLERQTPQTENTQNNHGTVNRATKSSISNINTNKINNNNYKNCNRAQ